MLGDMFKKRLTQLFACLSAREKGALDCLCSSFVDISESIILNNSISPKIRKELFRAFLLAWAPVHKEALAAFPQVLYTSVKLFFLMYH